MSYRLGQKMWLTASPGLRLVSVIVGFPALTATLLGSVGVGGQAMLMSGYLALCAVGLVNMIAYATRTNSERVDG